MTVAAAQSLSSFLPKGIIVNGVDLAELVAVQPNIAVTPGVKDSQKPLNDQSAKLLGAGGASATKFFGGLSDLVGNRAGASSLKGIALSTSLTAYAGQLAAAKVDDGSFAPKDVEGKLDAVIGAVLGADAVQQGGWIILGPISTKLAQQHLAGEKLDPKDAQRLAYVLRHELEHTISPRNSDAAINQEEAVADVMATLPGEIERTATTLGIGEVNRNGFEASYPNEILELGAKIKTHGVDITKPGSFKAVDELLQKQPVDDLKL